MRTTCGRHRACLHAWPPPPPGKGGSAHLAVAEQDESGQVGDAEAVTQPRAGVGVHCGQESRLRGRGSVGGAGEAPSAVGLGQVRQCRAADLLQQHASTHKHLTANSAKQGGSPWAAVSRSPSGAHLRLQQLLAQRLPLRGQLLARPGRGAAEVDKPDARGLARGGLRTEERRERFCGKGWPHCTAWHGRHAELCRPASMPFLAWVMCSKFSSFSVRRRCACAQPASSRQAASSTTPAQRILRSEAAGGAAAGGSAVQTASTQHASLLPRHSQRHPAADRGRLKAHLAGERNASG